MPSIRLAEGDPRLRVLAVSPDLSPALGGSVLATLELSKALVRAGAYVSLISTDLDETGRWSFAYKPKVLDVVPLKPIWVDGVRLLYFPTVGPSRFAFSPNMATALPGEAREHDVIHVHRLYRFPSMMASHTARRLGLPYVITPHGVLQPYHRRRRRRLKEVYNAAIQRYDLNRAAAVHYTSDHERQLSADLGIRAPAVVIPAGVNMADFYKMPARGSFLSSHPKLRQKKLVTFLGRLAPQKGIDLLILAFVAVRKSVGDAHLVIAGPDEDGHQKLVRRWIDNAGIADSVTLLGPVYGQEKLNLLQDTDAWVLSSYAENFGIAVVEALAAGLPTIITDKVGIHGAITQAGAGIVVGCDVRQLSEAVVSVLTNQELNQRLRNAGPRLVESRFTWDAAASQMMQVYRQLVEERSQAPAALG